jgi:5-methylcytosine-specific restriction endonuclease McrA
VTIRTQARQRTLIKYDRNGIAVYTKLKARKNLKIKKPLCKISDKQKQKNLRWKEVEAICLERANYTCEAKFEGCLGNKFLQGHHKIFRSKGGKNTVENCLITCQSCHDVFHGITHKKSNKHQASLEIPNSAIDLGGQSGG